MYVEATLSLHMSQIKVGNVSQELTYDKFCDTDINTLHAELQSVGIKESTECKFGTRIEGREGNSDFACFRKRRYDLIFVRKEK